MNDNPGQNPDQPKPDQKPDDKNKNSEEVDEGYSCSSCWSGYCACFVWTCKVIIKY